MVSDKILDFDEFNKFLDELNKLFKVLFAKPDVVIQDIKFTHSRQKTLDAKEVTSVRANISLETDDAEDYYSRTLRESGLSVKGRESFIEFTVSFDPIFNDP